MSKQKKSERNKIVASISLVALTVLLMQNSPSAADREAMRLPLAEKAPLVGLVQAGSRLVAFGDYGIILLSDDGLAWRQASSVPVDDLLTAITFADERRGWAVGHGGVVLQTEDGGENWMLQKRLPESPVLLSIWIGKAGQGIVVGAYGYAARTSDGGNTWEPVSPGGEGDDSHLNQIFPGLNGELFIAGEAGKAYRSLDGGQNWKALDTGADGSLWTGVAMKDGRLLMAGMSGRVLLSNDNGDTWQELNTGLHDAITALTELRDSRIALVGSGGIVSVVDRNLMRFHTHIRPDRQNLAALLPLNGLRVVTAGQQGLQVEDLPR